MTYYTTEFANGARYDLPPSAFDDPDVPKAFNKKFRKRLHKNKAEAGTILPSNKILLSDSSDDSDSDHRTETQRRPRAHNKRTYPVRRLKTVARSEQALHATPTMTTQVTHDGLKSAMSKLPTGSDSNVFVSGPTSTEKKTGTHDRRIERSTQAVANGPKSSMTSPPTGSPGASSTGGASKMEAQDLRTLLLARAGQRRKQLVKHTAQETVP
ncbi:hypothetical protein SARC_17711, partial [Sphaeroforma arctica JP610]